MITLQKLNKLNRETRLRKVASLLRAYEINIISGGKVDYRYFSGLLDILAKDSRAELLVHKSEIINDSKKPDLTQLRRLCNTLRHRILGFLDALPGDWDLISSDTGSMSSDLRKTVPIALYLEDLRSPYNVGAIFRAAESFGVDKIYLSPDTPSPEHPRALRTAMGCSETVRWEVAGLDIIAESEVMALELGGKNVGDFLFPSDGGVAIIGSEELGISPEAKKRAEQSLGLVSIPMYGLKSSLNVSVALGILLYVWRSKMNSQKKTGCYKELS